MEKSTNTVIRNYNVIGDDIFYHHTFSERAGSDYYHAPGTHRQHEVLLLLRGKVSYVIEGETYNVTEGDMIFVAPGEIHTLKIAGDQPYERIVLLFDMSVLDRMMRELNIELRAFSYDGRNRFHVIGSEQVAEYGLDKLLFDIISYDDSDKYKRLLIMSKLIRFVVCIDKMIEDNKNNFVKPYSRDKLIASATEYIDEHIREHIRLDDLAEKLYVSKSTLCHKFSSVMSMTVNGYVALKKMNAANELLRDGYPAAEVAAMLGYDNYTSFFYNYKKLLGRSPSAEIRGASREEKAKGSK